MKTPPHDGPADGDRSPPLEPSAERLEQMLGAFNIYRTETLLEMLDRPRAIVFVDGVAVEGEADVVTADPGGVILQVDGRLLAAISRTRSALIESPLHGATYRAALEEVDPARGYVSLCALEPFDARHERRLQTRTVPGMPMLARVHGLGHETSGRVVDLSPRSLAADFERERFERVAGAELVRVEVWGEHGTCAVLDDFETTARIQRTFLREKEGRCACRAVLALDTYPALDRALRRYVARRQREVLTELRLQADGVAAGGDASSASAGPPTSPEPKDGRAS
jgi:hypothetical protein